MTRQEEYARMIATEQNDPEKMRAKALDYARSALDMARKLIERMPAGYEPGQRSGPEERNVHAALVVALRLGSEAGVL